MKAVMISIRPEWVEKIMSGEKTIEVRKTAPKIETPFKCFVYCTKPRYEHEDFIVVNAGTENAFAFYGGGKVIGEFVCDSMSEIKPHDDGYGGNGSCLSFDELNDYLKGGNGYAWHISDLKIYDKPKELGEFATRRRCDSCEVSGYESTACIWDKNCIVPHQLSRAPQSWCYVVEIE